MKWHKKKKKNTHTHNYFLLTHSSLWYSGERWERWLGQGGCRVLSSRLLQHLRLLSSAGVALVWSGERGCEAFSIPPATKGRGIAHERRFSQATQRSGTHHFHLHSIGQNSMLWSHLNARETENYWLCLKKGGGGGGAVVGKPTRKTFTWHCMLMPLCNTMECCPPGSSVHGIIQARILEWVAMPSRVFLTEGSNPVPNWISCIAGGFFATERPGKSRYFDDSKQFSLSHFYLLLWALLTVSPIYFWDLPKHILPFLGEVSFELLLFWSRFLHSAFKPPKRTSKGYLPTGNAKDFPPMLHEC